MRLVSWRTDRSHVLHWCTVHGALFVTSRCKCFLKVFVNVGLAVVCTNIVVIIKAESCHSDSVSAPRTQFYGSDLGWLRYNMLLFSASPYIC